MDATTVWGGQRPRIGAGGRPEKKITRSYITCVGAGRSTAAAAATARAAAAEKLCRAAYALRVHRRTTTKHYPVEPFGGSHVRVSLLSVTPGATCKVTRNTHLARVVGHVRGEWYSWYSWAVARKPRLRCYRVNCGSGGARHVTAAAAVAQLRGGGPWTIKKMLS